ncbi:hypothetical protein TWF694_002742 [Orbilia ellipsospora]|uniref:Uncharacterized protein n=1 Tax=Orbilia ellipsospora TaxID=2528407 RepID=A0AAV9X2U4_9PEZI
MYSLHVHRQLPGWRKSKIVLDDHGHEVYFAKPHRGSQSSIELHLSENEENPVVAELRTNLLMTKYELYFGETKHELQPGSNSKHGQLTWSIPNCPKQFRWGERDDKSSNGVMNRTHSNLQLVEVGSETVVASLAPNRRKFAKTEMGELLIDERYHTELGSDFERGVILLALSYLERVKRRATGAGAAAAAGGVVAC